MIRKIGIYGGTFSPPHLGHVNAAEAFVREVDIDELLIMPDYLPPHKATLGVASPVDRVEMCKLAFGHIAAATVSDMEIKRGGKSYTAVTLTELASPERELYFLCGTDMLLTLDRWYDFKTIFNLATICYVRREMDAALDLQIEEKISEYEEKYSARIVKIPLNVIEVSSTDLRCAVSGDDEEHPLLPEKVYRYVKEKGLYK